LWNHYRSTEATWLVIQVKQLASQPLVAATKTSAELADLKVML